MPEEKIVQLDFFTDQLEAESLSKTYSILPDTKSTMELMDFAEIESRVASFMGVDFGVGESKSAVVDIYGSMVHEYRDIGTARVVSPSLYQEIQKAYPIKSMDHIFQAITPWMNKYFNDLDKISHFSDFRSDDGPRPHGPQYGWYRKFESKKKWT